MVSRLNQILCYDCQKAGKSRDESFIDADKFDQHQILVHGVQVEMSVLLAITSWQPRILKILQTDRRAQSDPARVVELCSRYWPYKNNADYAIRYNAGTQEIEMPHMPYHEWQGFRRYIDNIERIDREVREKHPGLNGSPRARIQREIREQTSRLYYGKESQEPTTRREPSPSREGKEGDPKGKV